MKDVSHSRNTYICIFICFIDGNVDFVSCIRIEELAIITITISKVLCANIAFAYICKLTLRYCIIVCNKLIYYFVFCVYNSFFCRFSCILFNSSIFFI